MVEIVGKVELGNLDHAGGIAELTGEHLDRLLDGELLGDDGEGLEGHDVKIEGTTGDNDAVGEEEVPDAVAVAKHGEVALGTDKVEDTHVEEHLIGTAVEGLVVLPDATAASHLDKGIHHSEIGLIGLRSADVLDIELNRLYVVLKVIDLGLVVADDADQELVALVPHPVLDAADDAGEALLILGNDKCIQVALKNLATALGVAVGQGAANSGDFALEAGLLAQEEAPVGGLLLVSQPLAYELVVAVALAVALDKAGARSAVHDEATAGVAHLAVVADAEIGVHEVSGDLHEQTFGDADILER